MEKLKALFETPKFKLMDHVNNLVQGIELNFSVPSKYNKDELLEGISYRVDGIRKSLEVFDGKNVAMFEEFCQIVMQVPDSPDNNWKEIVFEKYKILKELINSL